MDTYHTYQINAHMTYNTISAGVVRKDGGGSVRGSNLRCFVNSSQTLLSLHQDHQIHFTKQCTKCTPGAVTMPWGVIVRILEHVRGCKEKLVLPLASASSFHYKHKALACRSNIMRSTPSNNIVASLQALLEKVLVLLLSRPIGAYQLRSLPHKIQ